MDADEQLHGAQSAALADGPGGDLGRIARALWRMKWFVLGVTAVAAAATMAIVDGLAPEYTSTARVLIENQEGGFLRPESTKAGREPGIAGQESMTSPVELALSRDLARQVVKELELGERPELYSVLRGNSWIAPVLRAAGLTEDPPRPTPEERVLDAYYERLAVHQVDKSPVIAIEFQSRDPKLSAQVANAVAKGFVQLLRASRQRLAGRIADLRRKVADTEAQLEALRAGSDVVGGSTQQRGEIDAEMAAARARNAEAEANAKLVRDLRSGRPVDSADLLNSEVIRRLAEQRATLRAQLAEQSSTVLDAHPRIKELKGQISDIDRAMHVEADRLARSLENDAVGASARPDVPGSNLEEVKREAAASNLRDDRLRALEREAKAERDLLGSYLAKYRETNGLHDPDLAPAKPRVISPAVASSTPSFPRRVPTILIAAFSSFCIAIGFITTRELLAGGSEAPSETMAGADADGGTAPSRAPAPDGHAPPAGNGDILASAASELDWPHQSLAEIVAALTPCAVPGRRVAVVAGAGPNVGTAACAAALARLLTEHGRVVLIDLALAAPGKALAADPCAPGMTELVRGAASFGQIISRDHNSSVHLVRTGQVRGDEARGLLGSERLRVALDVLAHAYEYVVIDAGEPAQVMLDRVASRASLAVLVTTGASRPAAQLARERFAYAGFAEIVAFSEADAPVDEALRLQAAAA
jgi:polysaccharide biosynthesis transport protein